ncbi:MAG: hypothetical protein EZS26_001673 [Candidatus Ordinivivax streblomastigis]|uniref:Uncharacterized protein n=1 Tax=Candidatus Ordinivivax streblomastigis TaxID=2540710 RepID=A0A5M8P107_9BACT|nr:MAG: hypothetical protein EZS26_001673 [Candidatus Ordinivivax streblomastigis]
MKMKSIFGILFVTVTLSTVQAQVVIGKDVDPESWAVLEVASDVQIGGIRYPQLSDTQKNSLTGTLPTGISNSSAEGLMIFNTNGSGSGNMEYWTGLEWKSLTAFSDASNPAESSVGTIAGGATISPNSVSSPVTTYMVNFSGVVMSNIKDLHIGKVADIHNVVEKVEFAAGGTVIAAPTLISNSIKITFYPKAVALAAEKELRFTLYVTYLKNGISEQAELPVTVK